jgi:DNA-binding XRE family transcriptional regulator
MLKIGAAKVGVHEPSHLPIALGQMRYRRTNAAGAFLYNVLYNTQYKIYCSLYETFMKSAATSTLPRQARVALSKLGEDMAVARKKRRISTVSMAERAFISRGTLYKLERGDPSVSMGIYATVLAILGLAEGLGQVADRRDDTLGLDVEEDRLPKKIRPGSRRRKPS